tara:strand:+ start:3086 stop:3832 length:747 start_codon:yes stop_codon:yes gene_type:complete
MTNLGPISSNVNDMVNTPQTSNPTTQIDTATAFSDEATAAMEDTGLDQVGELDEEDKEFEKKFEKFYRRRFPGFTMSSGVNTLGHGKGELMLTTDTAQCIHFYEQGNCKIGSRNSIELKTGDKATEKDLSIFLSAENGVIKIAAPNGNLILQGENVLLEATGAEGQVTVKSQKNMYLESTSLTIDTDYATIAACSDMLLYGGNDTMLYCESGPPETASGGDPIIATSLTEKILAAVKNAKMLFTSGAV